MSDVMPDFISDNMSEVMPEPMSERIADTMLNNHWCPSKKSRWCGFICVFAWLPLLLLASSGRPA